MKIKVIEDKHMDESHDPILILNPKDYAAMNGLPYKARYNSVMEFLKTKM